MTGIHMYIDRDGPSLVCEAFYRIIPGQFSKILKIDII